MTSRIAAAALVLFVCSTTVAVAETPRKPNVVVVLSDDQGWGDLSINGNSNLRTPNLDSLAKNGARFSRFFVQPVCSPTRAEFLTGRYHPRCGVRGVTTGGERLNLSESTIADSFAAAGYATGCFGKWHNGTQFPYHALGRGFREFYGFTSGHWGDYFNPPLDHNGKPVTGNGFFADDITDRAIQFIDKNRQGPFFCYVAFNTPHSPMQVPDAYWNRFANKELSLLGSAKQKEDINHTRAALAMCENLDANVGRILKALDQVNLTNDTIVVYFCDNGPNGARWNGGMKGRKGSTDEGGVRSPLHIRWPNRIAAGTEVKSIAAAIDLLPTLVELTGMSHVGKLPLDGVSLAGSLISGKSVVSDRILFQHWAGRTSARSQTHRLDSDGKLFDMIADPEQTLDIAATNPETATSLRSAVAAWRKEALTAIDGKDDRPFLVGAKGFPRTELPARDGVSFGTIKRSAAAPNCSYFTNWTSPNDRITWDVEILQPGRHHVEVLHTCEATSVGTIVELSFSGRKIAAKVADVHDPKPHGSANDRVPRAGESLMKEFKPLVLGELKLPAGRGLLTLTAPKMTGRQAIDVRGLILIPTRD
jgi:arylsulfatase A-like enzyme